jgi:hypothetical protein
MPALRFRVCAEFWLPELATLWDTEPETHGKVCGII